MMLKKIFILLCLLLLSTCQRSHLKKEPTEESSRWSEVVNYADQHLPKSGMLVQNSDGYAYVKVDDDYIHQLFSRLNLSKEFKEPPYFRRKDAPGAHISVVYKNEHVVLKEVGQQFTFTLKDIVVVNINDTTSYVVLEVLAPSLEELRKRYGLSPMLNNHEFHITLAKRVISPSN